MNPAKGRRAAVVGTVFALAVLLGFLAVFKDRLIEKWYLRQLDSRDLKERQAAVVALLELGSGKIVPRLLRSPEGWNDQAHGAVVRKGLEKRGAGGVSDLLEEIRSDDWPFCRKVLDTLEHIQAPPSYEVAVLRKGLRDPGAAVRRWAAEATGRRPDRIRPLVPDLAALLRAPEEEVRFWAAMALGKLHPLPPEALEGFARALRDPSAEIRWWAAMALDQVTPRYGPLVPRLREAARDQDRLVRYWAEVALERINAR
jgi:HEAT repeat protein